MVSEALRAATAAIIYDNRTQAADVVRIPRGSLFCKCAAVPLRHELRKLDAASTLPKNILLYTPDTSDNTNRTTVPLSNLHTKEATL